MLMVKTFVCFMHGFAIFIAQINAIKAENNCNVAKIEYPIKPLSRVVLLFQCFDPTPINPNWPVGGSLPKEYNELNLSPNTYTHIPYHHVCSYENIYFLDLSYNKISDLNKAFSTLTCLPYLKQFVISYNSIRTPLVSDDFDDTFTEHLEYIDLSNNQIPSIETGVFIRDDGTTRFPNLTFLSLANNRLKEFDILWPMTIPSPSLHIDVDGNPIDKLVNQLGWSINDTSLHEFTGKRTINVTNNNLQYFDDSTLVQYGLKTSSDFEMLLKLLSNYDFRQVNNRIVCCKSETKLINKWFKNISRNLDHNFPILQLYCLNSTSVFEANCALKDKASKPVKETFRTVSPSNYWLLLLIPLILIPILLVVLFFCRQINIILWNHLNRTVCIKRKVIGINSKIYDAVICYYEADKHWVDHTFIPKFIGFTKNYEILLMKKGIEINKQSERVLHSTKCIVLICSHAFFELECLHQSDGNHLIKILRNIINYNKDCSIIFVSRDYSIDDFDNYLNMIKKRKAKKYDFLLRILTRIKKSFFIETIEVLEYWRKNFWSEFNFILPQTQIYSKSVKKNIVGSIENLPSSSKPRRNSTFGIYSILDELNQIPPPKCQSLSEIKQNTKSFLPNKDTIKEPSKQKHVQFETETEILSSASEHNFEQIPNSKSGSFSDSDKRLVTYTSDLIRRSFNLTENNKNIAKHQSLNERNLSPISYGINIPTSLMSPSVSVSRHASDSVCSSFNNSLLNKFNQLTVDTNSKDENNEHKRGNKNIIPLNVEDDFYQDIKFMNSPYANKF